MEELKLDNLIDQYLLGTINTHDKLLLERLMAEDTTVASKVQISKLAYKSIMLERNKLLREKLRTLDKNTSYEQRFASSWFGKVAMLIVVFILLYALLAVYFCPVSIARRNFIAFTETTSIQIQRDDDAWRSATIAFRDSDFEKAIQQYVILASGSDPSQHHLAKWNLLMSQLAADGPSEHWQIAMQTYAFQTPGSMGEKAHSVLELFHSPVYKFWFFPLSRKFSSLKPRLI